MVREYTHIVLCELCQLIVNDHPGLHHKMGEWTRCTGRALASSGGRTHHIGRQVHDSDRITFEVMTFILNLHRPNSYGPWVYTYSPLWTMPSSYADHMCMFLLGLIKKTTQINIIHQTNLNEIYCSDVYSKLKSQGTN
jgi:hypothetical protein